MPKAADHHVVAGEHLHARGDVGEAAACGLPSLRTVGIDLQQRRVHRLEVTARDAAQLTEDDIGPVRIRNALKEPVASAVGEHQSVFLECAQDHLRGRTVW